jgi:hypothetical protein
VQTVSPSFAPYSDVRWVDFSIRFELLDENARTTAVPSVSSQESVSQLEQLTDGVERMSAKYATLEPDSWLLDGGHQIMPDDVSDIQTGWWGDVLNGEDGSFPSPPSLSFYFGGISIDTIGYMLYFDATADSYPNLIRVTTYAADQTTIIEQETFANDRHNCVLDFPVQGYYKVKFEFLSTSKPQRRVRLAEVLFGIVQEFIGDNIESATISYAADLMAEAFPSRQLDFAFENIDHKYNLINPNGLYAYLQEGQDIVAHAVINDESVYMGTFEFTSATASDDEITGTITANDFVLAALEGVIYNGGSNTTTTLLAAVNSLLSGLGVEVSIAYPSYTVSMAIPQGTTKREALRMLAQAARCSVWVDRAGVLQIYPLTVSENADDELNADNMPSMGGIGVSEPVDSVALTVRNEYADTETIYTSGSGKRIKSVENPCVAAANGQAVADWLLAQSNRRVRYKKPNRGNPAVEIGDTLKIYDAYGENKNAVMTKQTIVFDGGLSAQTEAVG